MHAGEYVVTVTRISYKVANYVIHLRSPVLICIAVSYYLCKALLLFLQPILLLSFLLDIFILHVSVTSISFSALLRSITSNRSVPDPGHCLPVDNELCLHYELLLGMFRDHRFLADRTATQFDRLLA